jgi:hypothetical protein
MPDARKTNLPDSDETSRRRPPDDGQDPADATDLEIEGLQTSQKSGKHSSVEKLAASRPEFEAGRDARAIPGAFGDDDSHPVTGRNAAPGTNQFRCSACGRYFNTGGELADTRGNVVWQRRPQRPAVRAFWAIERNFQSALAHQCLKSFRNRLQQAYGRTHSKEDPFIRSSWRGPLQVLHEGSCAGGFAGCYASGECRPG